MRRSSFVFYYVRQPAQTFSRTTKSTPRATQQAASAVAARTWYFLNRSKLIVAVLRTRFCSHDTMQTRSVSIVVDTQFLRYSSDSESTPFAKFRSWCHHGSMAYFVTRPRSEVWYWNGIHHNRNEISKQWQYHDSQPLSHFWTTNCPILWIHQSVS